MTPRRLGTCALLLVGVAPLRAEEQAPARVESPHYVLHSAGPRAEAEESARVLEAAWPLFAAHFGAEPTLTKGERLRVTFTETAEACVAAVRAAGGAPPAFGNGVGGYYDPVSRGAFLYRQPTTWFTRALLLHECAHQFHFLATARNRAPPAAWYVEGLAEHLAHHTWDGATLRLGVVPLLSLEDYPAKARAGLAEPAFRLEPILDGASSPRPECMHLVRYLLGGDGGKHAGRFRALAEKVDRGAVAKPLFARAFGPEEPLVKGWRAWLEGAQQPWVPLHVEWEARGADRLRGTSAVVSACRVRGPARSVEARWVPPAGAWRAGALLAWSAPDDWVVGLVDGNGVRVHRFRAGAWTPLPAALPPPPREQEPWRLTARRAGERVTLVVNGAEVGAWTLPGEALGLAVDACRVDFTDVRWTNGG